MTIQKCDSILVWGVECISCFECKCRTFRNWDVFEVWLSDREFVVKPSWRRIFVRNKSKVVVYWCKRMPRRYVCTAPNLRSRNEDHCWYHNAEVEV